MKGKRGVSVIFGTILLISIAVMATAILYSLYAPQLMPQANTDKILEDVSIVLINATPVSTGPYWNYSVSVSVLNHGLVAATLDRIYIEDLSQSALFSQYVPLCDLGPTSDPTVLPGQGLEMKFWVNLTYDIFTEARIFKVVSLRGLAASYIFIPATSSQTTNSSGIGDSSFTRFNISGIKYYDFNHDNVLEAPDDYPMGGWVIILKDLANTFTRFAITDANGSYSFTGLDKGFYVVEEAMRPSNSSGRWNYSEAQRFTVLVNSKSEVVNFSNYFTGAGFSVSGNIFNDNGIPDGVKGGGEPGLSDWIVTIKFSGGPMFMAVKTDAQGNYSFSNLEAGDYTVEEILLKGWLPRNSTTMDVSIVNSSLSGINIGNYYSGITATEKYSLSGYVFNDTDADGVRDAGEAGLGSWFVTLDDGSGLLYGASTDSNGLYSFLVNNGTFTVEEVLFKDWYTTTGTMIAVTVAGLNHTGLNFGNYFNPLGTLGLQIGGTVFNDTVNQGVYDTGTENGMDGWLVNMVDAFGIPYSAITDSNGTYFFSQLLPGTYSLSVMLPPGFNSTTPATLSATVSNVSVFGVDFGAFKSGKPTISGRVFNDTDHDKVWNASVDLPLAGWLVSVNSSYKLTDINGLYSFGDLDNATYVVQEIPPVGWWNWTDRVVVVDTSNGSKIVDFANTLPFSNVYSVSGIIFRDDDRDGIFDNGTGDVLFTASTVTISANETVSNTKVASTTTSSGAFTITSLPPGNYSIWIDTVSGYTPSTTPFVLVTITNADVSNVTFGLRSSSGNATYTISGIKYNDTSPYGRYNTGDTPLSGWGIYLYLGTNTSTTPYKWTYTNSTGGFFFDDIMAGQVYTLVELVEPGWTYANSSFTTFNSSWTSGTPKSTFTLTNHTTVSYFNKYTAFSPGTKLYALEGVVFEDYDYSHNYTVGDALLPGWTVILQDKSNFPIDYAVTNSTGGYSFVNLPKDDYSLLVIVQSGWTNTTPYFMSFTNYAQNLTVNFGFRTGSTPRYNTISGYKFNDTNANGVWDAGEPGIPGWSIWLYSGTYSPAPNAVAYPYRVTTTDSTGMYTFSSLSNATYTVIEIQQSNWTNTSPRQIVVTLSGASRDSVNFGNRYTPTATPYFISGFKYNDVDNSSSYQPTETKIYNWMIYINDGSGYPINRMYTLTSPRGYYNFTGLTAGTYTVFEQTGGSYPVNTTARIVNVTITSVSNASVDFGNRQNVIPTYTISGSIFNDTNSDGAFNENDTMTNSWTVFLYSGSYTPYSFPTTWTSTSTGQYQFTGLTNGNTYTVVEMLKNGYTNLWPRSLTYTINGENCPYADFFNQKLANPTTRAVYGYKFNDTDANGLWNATDESGMGSWQIMAYDQFGFPLGIYTTSTSSSSLGYYGFSLPNGNYTLKENLASNPLYVNSTLSQVNITVSGSNYRYDFGNYLIGKAPAYNFYGWVFNDTNQNAVQDAGEQGISSWFVSLYHASNDSYVGQCQTNASGFYVLPAVLPGNYKIVCTPASYYFNTSASTVYATLTTGDMNVNFSWVYNFTGVVPHTISGRVYNGTNTPANGLANWLVLVNNSTFSASTLTDSVGTYSFTLYNGWYVVEAVVPGGYTNITNSIVNLTLSGSNIVQDFGMNVSAPVAYYTVSGTKYNETGMVPVPNWIVTISGGSYWKATTTNSSGVYLFTGVPAGIYTVEEMMQSGWTNSTPRIVSVNVSTSNVTGINFINKYSFVVGQNFSIGGLVYNDINKNGNYEAGTDLALPNWNVLLRDSLGIPYSNTTDASGNYAFSNLLAGNYIVTIIKPNEGWVTTTPTTRNITITNSSITGINFGSYDNWFDIQGRVYFDTNNNTVYDPSIDYPLTGWLVNLTNSGGQSIITATNASGIYRFTDQPSGNYTLSEIREQGWNSTTPMSVTLNLTSDTIRNFGNDRDFSLGQYYSQTKEEWSSDSLGFLTNNFTYVYLSHIVEIGIPNSAWYSAAWDNVTYIRGYLANSRPVNYLDKDYNKVGDPTNPINPNGALDGQGGTFGANVLALQLNVNWSNANLGYFNTEFDSLRLYNYGASVDGKTIGEILAIANTMLGSNGTGLPSGFTLGQFSTLLGEINDAFYPLGGDLTWANQHLF